MKIRETATAVIGAVALIAGASPALAKGNSAEARQAAAKYVSCLFNRDDAKVRRILSMPFGDTDSIDRLRPLADSECITHAQGTSQQFDANFPPILLRGMLYQELYARDFAGAGAAGSFEGVLSPGYPVVGDGDFASAYRSTVTFGECVVRRSSKEARALILSPIGSPAETAALQAMTPAFTPCVDTGQTIQLTLSVVRAAIAEPLYRLSGK